MPLILPSIQHGVRPRIEQVVREQGLKIENVIDITSIAILKSAILADLWGHDPARFALLGRN